MMLAEQIELFRLKSRRQVVYELLLIRTFCMYVIPKVKVLTEIFSGIGMVNTEKYRPIPTKKYRFDTKL